MLNQFYLWTDRTLFWGVLLLHAWAVVDCAIRTTQAFPAADKLTKPKWLAITVFSAVISALPPFYAPLAPISLAADVVALVYLVDVRPAVREISRGSR